MTSVMMQPGLAAPTSRQDIVSALLNDYSTFGTGEESPIALSPFRVSKELPPPPPPRRDTIRNKPLPAVQRMSMKFPLRDDEIPSSPDSPDRSVRRKRIAHRSLSRDGKPPSLKLTVSNGSTATIPPTPVVAALQQTVSPSVSTADKELPPSPPAKSERRKTQQPLDNEASRSTKELSRNDSLLSPNKPTVPIVPSTRTAEVAPAVKRKALPEPALKQYRSLAELGQGPRGGKGGSAPPRKASVDSQASETSHPQDQQMGNKQAKPVEERGQLPPTPDDEKDDLPLAPPRKIFTGLPSNPRSKAPASPRSPLHIRGKSSTGFNILKAHRPAPPIPTMPANTITPEMTPSPTLKPDDTGKNMDISPLSPLPPRKDQTRPFSFETPTEPERNEAKEEEAPTVPAAPAIAAREPSVQMSSPQKPATLPVATINEPAKSPIRPTSLDLSEPSPRQPSPIANVPTPITKASTQSPPVIPSTRSPAAAASSPAQQPAPSTPHSPPPFTPLTRKPVPVPATLIPAITSTHLDCFTAHARNIWSTNHFQPMGCMVCGENDKERKWACTWCQLRVCRACSEELRMVPGRKLGELLRAKGLGKEEEEVEVVEEKEKESGVTVVVRDEDGEVMLEGEKRGEEDVYDPFRG